MAWQPVDARKRWPRLRVQMPAKEPTALETWAQLIAVVLMLEQASREDEESD